VTDAKLVPRRVPPPRVTRPWGGVPFVFGALLAAAACGPPTHGPARVLFECRSPSGNLKAVYWVRSGGGAAGWVQQVLSVIPVADASADLWARSERDTLINAAWFAHTSQIQLAWAGDNLLLVGYPETGVVLEATPGSVYTRLTPALRIRYRSVPVERDGEMAGGSSCSVSAEAATSGMPQSP
jgi:hypothetical protein